jgi:long-subunit fatty acid transport protein
MKIPQYLRVFITLLCGLFLTSPAAGQNYKKIAQTGMQFLSVTSDARAAALAGAMTSTPLASSSLFFNPAGMAEMDGILEISASHNQWIADIDYNTVSLAMNPGRGLYGVFGVSLQFVDYGEVLGTMVADNEKGYVDTEKLSPSAFAVGVGYAKALNDRFSVGGQIKWVRWDLEQNLIPLTDSTTTKTTNEITPLAFDFGTFYKTGFKSLVFGMSVRNFSKEIKFVEEGFQLPLVFTMGLSMNMLDLTDFGPDHELLLMLDASHYRSHPEQILIGLDYRFTGLLSLRGGYIYGNDEDGITFGFGVSQFGLDIDYAYTPYGVFDNVQRLTARFSLR